MSDRVRRAIPGHQTIASATITVRVPGPSIAATTIARISSGNANTMSAPASGARPPSRRSSPAARPAAVPTVSGQPEDRDRHQERDPGADRSAGSGRPRPERVPAQEVRPRGLGPHRQEIRVVEPVGREPGSTRRHQQDQSDQHAAEARVAALAEAPPEVRARARRRAASRAAIAAPGWLTRVLRGRRPGESADRSRRRGGPPRDSGPRRRT